VSLQAQGLQKAQGELSQPATARHGWSTARRREKSATGRRKRARDAIDKLPLRAALAVKEEPRGTVITLPGAVLFPSASTTFFRALAKARSNPEALEQTDHKMIVEGHTDSQGPSPRTSSSPAQSPDGARTTSCHAACLPRSFSANGLGQSRPWPTTHRRWAREQPARRDHHSADRETLDRHPGPGAGVPRGIGAARLERGGRCRAALRRSNSPFLPSARPISESDAAPLSIFMLSREVPSSVLREHGQVRSDRLQAIVVAGDGCTQSSSP